MQKLSPRLNGTGVPDLGDLLILPFNGEIEQEVYYSRINKERERMLLLDIARPYS